MNNTVKHLTNETEALFDEFLDNTKEVGSANVQLKKISTASEISLLEIMNMAKNMVEDLQKIDKPDNENVIENKINHIESELTEIKKILSK